KEIQPDIVHGQDLVFAGIWAYLSGFHPYVVTTWGSDVWKFDSFITLEKHLVRKTLQEADLITGSSLALKQQSIKIGMPEKNWQLVHFGINLETFKNKQLSSDLVKKIKASENKKIIFCPRSIAPVYNTDILIDTMALIDREANAKLFLMETGADSQYLKRIKKQIEIKNLEEEIVFFGKISREVMIDLYNLADVIVSITTSDGCSVSFLEAMACEKKIVATDLPYIQEWKKGKNFWTVPVKDAKKTAIALMDALNYPSSKWKKIGRGNRQLVLKNAEVDSNFEKLDKLYRKLL
ncbi:MAG: glycosyltransferase family 4 protein, partial [Patescibacteria group bacterium]